MMPCVLRDNRKAQALVAKIHRFLKELGHRSNTQNKMMPCNCRIRDSAKQNLTVFETMKILHLRAVRMRRFAVLPDTPLNGVKVDLRAQVRIDPLVVICPATRELNSHNVVPFGDTKFEALVARCS
jgi:hypothetical protein